MERFGRTAYPQARSLMLLCDGGGSNPADTERGQAHLFRTDLQGLANDLGMEIRMRITRRTRRSTTRSNIACSRT